MTRIRKYLSLMATLCTTALLGACGGDSATSGGGKYIEGKSSYESSLSALEGTFQLHRRLVPIHIDVAMLDENLDSIGTLDVKLERHRSGEIHFASDSIEFTSPYLRINYTCIYADSASNLKMDFTEYVDIDKVKSPVLSLPGALEGDRVKFLVQQDGFYLENAKQKALREIYDILAFDNRKNVSLEDDELWEFRSDLNDWLYNLCIIEKPDTAFYANYGKLRSELGSGKTWHDLLSETEIADTLFANDPKEDWTELWTKIFGLPDCDSSSISDTASATNKESAYYKKKFICDNSRYINHYKWRLFSDLENEKGTCTLDRRDTVEYEGLVYTCNKVTEGSFTKAVWKKIAGKDAVTYLHGKCHKELEGDTISYDSTYYACVYENNKTYVWTTEIPINEKWSDPTNVFVRKKIGLCDDTRNLETAIIEGRYYQCYDRAWQEIDRLTYFLGRCDSLGWDKKKAHHDSVGYFICRKGEWTTSWAYSSKWEEILIPDYYGDECTSKQENYIKQYDGTNFICRVKWGWNSFWDVASDNDMSVPLRNGKLCTQENNGEVVEFSGKGYWCVAPNWKEATEYHLTVFRAMERNNFKPDYCRNGSDNTTIFWDKADSTFYGCVNKYTDVNFGWGQVKRDATKSTSFAEFKDTENLVGGIYEDNDHYTITKDGWKYTFTYYTSGVNNDNIRVLRLQKVVTNTGAIIDVYENNIMVFRAALGDSAATLDDIEEKSPSFENYFADWKQKIIESTRCPDATLPGFNCVSDWEKSSIEIKLKHYNKDSYTTLEQAMAFCPEGSHIPSAEEWLVKNYAQSYKHDRASNVKQIKSNGQNGDFTADYNLVWTSTEKDSDTQYCFEYVKKDGGWNGTIVAGGIVECPKDLYPMVQAFCVSDGGAK